MKSLNFFLAFNFLFKIKFYNKIFLFYSNIIINLINIFAFFHKVFFLIESKIFFTNLVINRLHIMSIFACFYFNQLNRIRQIFFFLSLLIKIYYFFLKYSILQKFLKMYHIFFIFYVFLQPVYYLSETWSFISFVFY